MSPFRWCSAKVGGIFAAVVVMAVAQPCAIAPGDQSPATMPVKLTTYRSLYYDIHTDLDRDTVREAVARLTAMALEYRRRTKDLSDKRPRRMPFYLFSRREDYYAAGGIRGTKGMCFQDKLMAFAPKHRERRFWQTLQHEAFHQFAYQAISRNMPVWLGEGLAEYFEYGIWTGDGFVTGLIPPERLKRIKKMIAEKKLRSFDRMIAVTHAEWNTDIQMANYDQAWSMVHFFVQAEAGKHQDAFAQFVDDIADGRPAVMAFKQRFGRDLRSLKRRYCRWWASLGENPTADEYDLAMVQTLTSYLARAYSQRQTFDGADTFLRAARRGRLRCSPKQWLPPSLLADALKQVGDMAQWSLVGRRGSPSLVLTRPDGAVFTGTFETRDGHVTYVKVRISRPAATRPSRPALRPVPGR